MAYLGFALYLSGLVRKRDGFGSGHVSLRMGWKAGIAKDLFEAAAGYPIEGVCLESNMSNYTKLPRLFLYIFCSRFLSPTS